MQFSQKTLESDLTKRVIAHQLTVSSKYSFSTFQIDPEIEISMSFSSNSSTLSLKKSKIQDQGQEFQYPVRIQEEYNPITENYQAIHFLLRQKYNNLQSIYPAQYFQPLNAGWRVEKFQLSFGDQIRNFILVYCFCPTDIAANSRHTDYLNSIKDMEGYIPKIYCTFCHILQRETAVIVSYISEYYLTLTQISELSFKVDNQGQIKESVSLIEDKLKKERKTVSKRGNNIGLTYDTQRVVWLPFQKFQDSEFDSQMTSILEMYQNLFTIQKKNAINLRSIWRYSFLQHKYKNRLYYLYSEQSTEGFTLFYSLKQCLRQVFVLQQQTPFLKRIIEKQSQDLSVLQVSNEKYVKFFKGSNLEQLAGTSLKEYVMTREYSKLNISPNLFMTSKEEQVICYFWTEKYRILSEIFIKPQEELSSTQVVSQSNKEITQFYNGIENLSLIQKVNKMGTDIQSQMQELHSQGVIHGDIKLTNIVFDQKNDIFKLIDFGLALVLNESKGQKTRIGNGFGTLGYISEQMMAVLLHKQVQIDLYYNDIFCLQNTKNRIGKWCQMQRSGGWEVKGREIKGNKKEEIKYKNLQ